GQSISGFTDNGDSTYSMIYTVQEGDPDALQVADIAIYIVLENSGLLNTPFTSSADGTVAIDAHRPVITGAVRYSDTELAVVLSEPADTAGITALNDGGFSVVEYMNSGIEYLVTEINPGTTTDSIILTVEDMSASGDAGISVSYTQGGNGNVTDIAGNLMLTDPDSVHISPWILGPATDLLISEYIEGSSNSKAIEIYNGTGTDVDLSHYSLEKDVNGDGIFGNTYTYSGMLANGEVFVLSRSDADPALVAVADDLNGGIINFNGNDQVRLLKDGVELDRIGISGGIDFAKDFTYVRKPFICSPAAGEQDPRTNGEWNEFPQNTFSNMGWHLSDCIGTNVSAFRQKDSRIISVFPNPNDGRFMIRLSGAFHGEINIQVVDMTGRKVYGKIVSAVSENTEICLEISDMPSGIYNVIICGNDEVFTAKILIFS
ncbi:MAG: lamin tail domain-containing protein, partial [Bacteroidetes bacterium]|nr:lamin tail domain-containing protein [Bacteroidota bacterium]